MTGGPPHLPAPLVTIIVSLFVVSSSTHDRGYHNVSLPTLDELLQKQTNEIRTRRQLAGAQRTDLNHRTITTDDVFAHLLSVHCRCGWDHTVVFSDTGDQLVFNSLLRVLQATPSPVTHILVREDWSVSEFKSTFLEFFENQGIKNFMFLTNRIQNVLNATREIYTAYGKRTLLGLQTKLFIAIGEDLSHLLRDVEFWNSVDFNNVFVVEYQNVVGVTVNSAWTLMWKSGRKRKLDQVYSRTWPFPQTFFPNLAFKLNGRNLLCLTKVFSKETMVATNATTGDLHYVGYAIDILDLLSITMNFTYTTTPRVEDEPFLGWDSHSQKISEYEVDFGVPAWSYASGYTFNHSVAFSILFDKMTGACVYSEAEKGLAMTGWERFDGRIYYAILGLLVVMATLISVINAVLPALPDHDYPPPDARKNILVMIGPRADYRRSPEFERSFEDTVYMENTSNNNNRLRQEEGYLVIQAIRRGPDTVQTVLRKVFLAKKTCTLRLSDVLDVGYKLFGAVLQQGVTIPLRSQSARYLLWTWTIAFLVFTLTYKGLLTAEQIQGVKMVPIDTFEKLLAVENRQWCIPNDYLTLVTAMKNAKANSVLGRLHQDVLASRGTTCETVQEMFDKIKQQKNFIGIAGRMDFFSFQKEDPDGHKLVIFTDDLMTQSSGIPFPKLSPLNQMFSYELEYLMGRGFYDHLLLKWFGEEEKMSEDDQSQSSYFTGVDDMLGTFLACGVGLGCSVLVLVLELLLGKWLKRFSVCCGRCLGLWMGDIVVRQHINI